VKGKQDSGVSKPVTSHPKAEEDLCIVHLLQTDTYTPRCQQRTELILMIFVVTEYGLVRSGHT
jgi:hypothetical protein